MFDQNYLKLFYRTIRLTKVGCCKKILELNLNGLSYYGPEGEKKKWVTLLRQVFNFKLGCFTAY